MDQVRPKTQFQILKKVVGIALGEVAQIPEGQRERESELGGVSGTNYRLIVLNSLCKFQQ